MQSKYFIKVSWEPIKLDIYDTSLKYSFESWTVIKSLHDDGWQAKVKVTHCTFELIVVVKKCLQRHEKEYINNKL